MIKRSQDEAQLALALAQSDILHERVRGFASRWADVPLQASVNTRQGRQHASEFEALARQLIAFQTGVRAENATPFVDVAVPADCFRFSSVFRFPIELAQLSFVTSGTTASAAGTHRMRVRETYEHLCVLGGQHGLGLGRDMRAPIILALAPWTGRRTSSSLGYMMQRFMERFDGRALDSSRDPSGFRLDHAQRWLVSDQGIDVTSLQSAIELSFATQTRLVLLATSFALVRLLDQVGERSYLLPPGSVIMQTGGFKGRSRSVTAAELERALHRVFGEVDVVGEYGMTELSSQLYERPQQVGSRTAGLYYEPPWLRVVVCDPVSLQPVPDGEEGMACFIDLGNVDTAAVVLTQDRVRREAGGVRLLGRLPGAPLRGCSLAVEALFGTKPSASAIPPGPRLTAPMQAEPTSRQRASSEQVAQADALGRVTRLLAATRQARDALVSAGADGVHLTGGVTSNRVSNGNPVDELAASSGLSPAGVRLALELSLELEPSAQDLSRLLASIGQARALYQGTSGSTVWVILSATVFTAAHRALALALAVGADVRVKPSRRAPEFVRYLHACDPGLFQLADAIEPRSGDQVFAYGSDQTLTDLRASLPPGVTLHGHGHGIGVAVLGPGAAVVDAARGLAQDIVLFDQQGCLSPRLVLAHPAVDVCQFRQALIEQLDAWEQQVPRGPLSVDEQRAVAWSERVTRTLAPTWVAGKGWVADYGDALARAESVPLAPACRAISLAQTAEPTRALSQLAPLITCVGYSAPTHDWSEVRSLLPHARHVPLGQMQRPPLDGPVDKRSVWHFAASNSAPLPV